MHYDDEQVLQNATLKVVVYIHEIGGSDDKYFQLNSIQECRYIRPETLGLFIESFMSLDNLTQLKLPEQSYYKSLERLKTETWHLITFGQDEDCNLIWYDCKSGIMNRFAEEPFLGLH